MSGTTGVSLDFSFRARAGSRRRKQPLFFLRYMWRTRRVITQWNFPRTVQFPWRTLYLFFSLSLSCLRFSFCSFSFFFFWSIFFWDFPQSETSTSNPFIFVAWSSMLRRERNRISVKIQENSSSWTPRLSVDSKKRKKWQRWEKKGKRESVVLRLFLLGDALVINDGHSINKNTYTYHLEQPCVTEM